MGNKMNQSIFETFLGFIILLITIYCVYFFVSNSGDTLKGNQAIEISASFDKANGLKSGSLVKISGITVGSVKSLTLNKETFEAKVHMIIQDDLLIPSDSEAVVEMDGIFGDTFVSLIPGGDNNYLAPGDEIVFTQGTSSILSLLSSFLN